MTNIIDVIVAPAQGAFFYDDQAAIRRIDRKLHV